MLNYDDLPLICGDFFVGGDEFVDEFEELHSSKVYY